MIVAIAIVVLALVFSGTLGFYLDRKALEAGRQAQEAAIQAESFRAAMAQHGRILLPDQVVYPVPPKHHLFHRKHKPTLAELEAKSRQMEEEALLTPESIWADNEKWIQGSRQEVRQAGQQDCPD